MNREVRGEAKGKEREKESSWSEMAGREGRREGEGWGMGVRGKL